MPEFTIIKTTGTEIDFSSIIDTMTGALTSNPTPISNTTMPHISVTMKSFEMNGTSAVEINQGYDINYNFSTIPVSITGQSTRILKFGNTDYGIKFSTPNVNNKVYVTYVEKDASYAGGYRDYLVTPLPDAWLNAAITYFNATSLTTLTGTLTKVLNATFTGTDFVDNTEVGIIKFKFRYTNTLSVTANSSVQ